MKCPHYDKCWTKAVRDLPPTSRIPECQSNELKDKCGWYTYYQKIATKEDEK